MIVWEILVVLLLVLVNGLLAMSELAVVSARPVRLREMAKSGKRGAAVALRLLDDPTKFLSTVQIGITLVGIFAGAYSGRTLAGPLADWLATFPLIARYADTTALVLVVVSVTYVSLVAGELVPKRFALAHAESIAAVVARPMSLLSRIGAPVVWILGISTNAVLTLFGVSGRRDDRVSEDEVRALIAEGTKTGIFHQTEREMIDGVLRLADRSVRSVMTPRVDIAWLDVDADPATIASTISDSSHSRVPVASGELDEIVGIVHAKDLLDRLVAGREIDLRECLRKPLVVHDRMTVLKLMEAFRRDPVHMAVIVDEYGTVEGLATPTDILAAIAGDLPEDADTEDPEIVRRDDGSWLIDGMTDIDRVATLLGAGVMTGDHDYNTLAGFVLWQLGRLPHTGDAFDWEDYRFEVVDMDGRRIDRVLISRRP